MRWRGKTWTYLVLDFLLFQCFLQRRSIWAARLVVARIQCFFFPQKTLFDIVFQQFQILTAALAADKHSSEQTLPREADLSL
jgi:hypothetical protein